MILLRGVFGLFRRCGGRRFSACARKDNPRAKDDDDDTRYQCMNSCGLGKVVALLSGVTIEIPLHDSLSSNYEKDSSTDNQFFISKK